MKSSLIAGMIALLLGIFNPHLYAQSCPESPADCPDRDYVNTDRAEDSTERILNPLVPQEISMEYRLRDLTGRLVRSVAAREHWAEPVEITEGGASGFRTSTGAVLPYSLRPPHYFTITWRVVVNPDSLQKWQNWLIDFANRRTDNMRAYSAVAVSKQDVFLRYRDSASYYSDRKADYMTAHYAAYQQAVMAGNKAGIDAYEKAIAVYDKKIDAFLNKAGDSQKNTDAENSEKNFDAEQKNMSFTFRESVVLLVEFNFNPDQAGPNNSTIKAAGTISQPGFRLLKWYFNQEPQMNDNVHAFDRSKNIVIGLTGGWNLVLDRNDAYVSSFKQDKTSTNKTDPKAIKCDQVQSASLYLSGNKAAMKKFLADFEVEEWNRVIVK